MYIDVENIEIVNATYPSINDRNIILVEYIDITGELKGFVISSDDDTDFGKKVFEKYDEENLAKNTVLLHEKNAKDAQDFLQFLEWKENGFIDVKNEVDQLQTTEKIELEKNFDLNYVDNMTSEDLFAFKMNIFDIEEFQNLEDRNIRSCVRKASSFPELMYYYYEFKKKQEEIKKD